MLLKTKRNIRVFLLLLMAMMMPLDTLAVQESVPAPMDPRMRTFTYRPDDVYIYKGYYGYASHIEFSPNEEIKTIAIGDSTGWQITKTKTRLFLKPVDPEATTNMTVMTDRRIYHFELYGVEADGGITTDGLAFITRFQYTDDGALDGSIRTFDISTNFPDLENKDELKKYNFNYTVTGDKDIAPLKIFDDGEFTYMQFANINADIPAIFVVDKKGSESLINYRIDGPYIVIERAAGMFTLRHGPDEVACVFNETAPLIQQRDREPWLGIF